MKKNQNRLIAFTALMILVLFIGYHYKHVNVSQETFSAATFQYGAKGEDVYELQARMKFLGFYFGPVDGQFGYKTLKSVKYFQSEFGLPVDGIVGPKTKVKLWEATKSWAPTENWKQDKPASGAVTKRSTSMTPSSHAGVTDNDLKLMANAVFGEARGESYIGQVAVAAVILNRVKSAKFPNTVSGVIFQPGAFTAVSDGQIWLTPNASAKKAVLDALGGDDPTNGCIYYFNPATATSKWIWSRQQVLTIGKHIFAI
jgi:N-acetylmuramoyl-L-alanine amidase